TPASEETYLEELDEEVSASNEIAPDLVAETGSVVAVSEVKNQTQTPEKPQTTKETKPVADSKPATTQKAKETASETGALYPKTVAKNAEKVVLLEPTETSAPAETVATSIPLSEPETLEEEPVKVVLQEPATTPAPKTVSVPEKKPVTPAAEPKPVMHKVVKGETLYSLSKRYNVTPSDIQFWNELGEKPL